MRIGLVTTSYPRTEKDSAGSFVREMARFLARAGHEVEVVAPASDSSRTVFDPDIRVTTYGRLLSGSGLFYRTGAPEALEQRPWLWAGVPYAVADLFRAVRVRSRSWDAVVSHWVAPSALITCLAADGKPHLAVAHSADAHLLARLPGRGWACDLLCSRTSGVVFSCSAAWEVLSSQLSPGMSSRLYSHSVVQPMGIDVNASKRGRRRRTRRKLGVDSTAALFLGRLVPVKRPDWIIRLARRMDGVTFLTAGDGPLRSGLEAAVRTHGLEHRVRLLGGVGPEEKADLLEASDLLILPSGVLSSGRTEGVPVAVLEAMAAGRPVVASDVGGVREVLTDGVQGFVVDPDDFETMVAAVRRLSKDRELRKKLGDNGARKAVQFDWPVVGKRFLELLVTR
jgi:glycosyltransferase involved in cell wall biosynthesis